MSENKILKMPHHHMKRLGLWSLRELIKPSEYRNEPYVMVDDGIFDTVQELNRWGLKTLYSCEGHEGENPRDEHSVWRYVMFRDKVKGLYPLPDEGREKSIYCILINKKLQYIVSGKSVDSIYCSYFIFNIQYIVSRKNLDTYYDMLN